MKTSFRRMSSARATRSCRRTVARTASRLIPASLLIYFGIRLRKGGGGVARTCTGEGAKRGTLLADMKGRGWAEEGFEVLECGPAHALADRAPTL